MKKNIYILFLLLISLTCCEKDFEYKNQTEDKVTCHIGVTNGDVKIFEETLKSKSKNESLMQGDFTKVTKNKSNGCMSSYYVVGIQIKDKSNNQVVASGLYNGNYDFSNLTLQLSPSAHYEVEATALENNYCNKKEYISGKGYKYDRPFRLKNYNKRLVSQDANWMDNPEEFLSLADASGSSNDFNAGDRWYFYDSDFCINEDGRNLNIALRRVGFRIEITGGNSGSKVENWAFYMNADYGSNSINGYSVSAGGNYGATFATFQFAGIKDVYNLIKNNPNYSKEIKYRQSANLKMDITSSGEYRKGWSHLLRASDPDWVLYPDVSQHNYPEHKITVKPGHCYKGAYNPSFECKARYYYIRMHGSYQKTQYGGSDYYPFWQGKTINYGSQTGNYTLYVEPYPSNGTADPIKRVRWEKCSRAYRNDYVEFDDEYGNPKTVNIHSYPFGAVDYPGMSIPTESIRREPDNFYLKAEVSTEDYHSFDTYLMLFYNINH